jgi:hypothetical protein
LDLKAEEIEDIVTPNVQPGHAIDQMCDRRPRVQPMSISPPTIPKLMQKNKKLKSMAVV